MVGYRDVPGRPAMFATTKGFLDHFNLKNLDELPPLAALRELEPEPILAQDDDDPAVPQSLQARADMALADEGYEPEADAQAKAETSFGSLLAELDAMEQGLKIDFDDLARAVDESNHEVSETVSNAGDDPSSSEREETS